MDDRASLPLSAAPVETVGAAPLGIRLEHWATYAAVTAALVLAGAKAAAWGVTGSVSLLSSLVDSLLDFIASLINLVAVREALKPPTQAYRFGRGKLEPLAALGQAAFISGSALLLFVEAYQHIRTPRPVEQGEVGIAVMLFAIVVTVALVIFQRYVVRRTKSLAIGADALHYTGDLLTNGAVILAIVLSTETGFALADPIFGLGIAAFILFNAWKIAIAAFRMLLDRELPENDRRRILDIALTEKEVVAVHDLRTRAAGPDIFIQFHLELPSNLPLKSAHEIADRVEKEVRRAFPTAEVIIHQDPEGIFETHPFSERVKE